MAQFTLLRLVRLCGVPILLACLLSLLPIGQMSAAHALSWGDLASAWSDIFKSPPPRPMRGVGRGDAFCAIAPFPTEAEAGDQSEAAIVTHQPVFVWRGGAEWLKVRSAETGELLWEKDLSADPDQALHRVAYAGSPLQAGQSYEWVIKPRRLAALLPIEFRVLSAAEQTAVEAELRSRRTAVRRADYFAERQLWSAFWDEILAVEDPAATLQAVVQKTVQYSCDASEAEN
jgi:hypothetical protein